MWSGRYIPLCPRARRALTGGINHSLPTSYHRARMCVVFIDMPSSVPSSNPALPQYSADHAQMPVRVQLTSDSHLMETARRSLVRTAVFRIQRVIFNFLPPPCWASAKHSVLCCSELYPFLACYMLWQCCEETCKYNGRAPSAFSANWCR